VRRVLPLLAVLTLAGCGSNHPKPRPAPALSTLLARAKTAHFVLDGTVKIELQSLLARLHPISPFHLHASGDASRSGLTANGVLHGDVSGSGRLVVAGKKAYAQLVDTWYELGRAKTAADLLRGAHWTVEPNSGRPRALHGRLHLTAQQLETLSGMKLPFGVEGADVSLNVRLSRWGEPVTIAPPRTSEPICIAENTCGRA
jgi:hypothetical protein